MTAFSGLHPISLIIYVAAALVPSMGRPLIAAAAGLLFTIFAGVIQDGGRWLKKSVWLLLLMGVTITLLTPVFNREGKTELFRFLGGPVTLEALLLGVGLGLSLMTILAVFGVVNTAFTPEAFLYLFSRVAPQSALVLMLTSRFIPELRRRLSEISLLRRSMRSKKRSPAALARDGGDDLKTLMSWSLEDAVITAISMRARGYGLVRRRSSYHSYRFGFGDALFIAMAVCLSACVLLAPTPLSGIAWCVLLAAPAFMEGWDALRWRLYALKT